MRAGHPALQEAWNLDTFCRQRFALGSFYGGSLSGTIDDTLRELGYRRHVAVSLQHFALIPELLRQSDLLAVIPASLVRADDGLVLKICLSRQRVIRNCCSGTTATTPIRHSNGCAGSWRERVILAVMVDNPVYSHPPKASYCVASPDRAP